MASRKLDKVVGILDQMLSTNLTELSADFLSLELCANKKIVDYPVLKKLQPKFCSIPWLPDSNNKADDVDNIPAILLAEKLKSEGHTVLLHLAANDLNRNQIAKILKKIEGLGLKYVLALQGDFAAQKPVSFAHASDLVTFIKQTYGDGFCVGVAGYPDKHPAAGNLDTDLRRLKEKVDCGADFIITQAVFDFHKLQSFHDNCRQLNITVPIIPGIFVIHSHESLEMMSNICKIPLPGDVKLFTERNKDNPRAIQSYGVEKAADTIKEIFQTGNFPGIHIFTLNRLDVVQELYTKLEL